MKKFRKALRALALVGLSFFMASRGNLVAAQPLPPLTEELTNIDERISVPITNLDHSAAIAQLTSVIPDARVTYGTIIDSPRWITASRGFLTGPHGAGRALSESALSQFPISDSNRVVRAFLRQYMDLFGHGDEVLQVSKIKRESVLAHNGLRTVVWEQQLDGIPLFDALLISHITARGELVSISSHFVPAPERAANIPKTLRLKLEADPEVTATSAVVNAAKNIGETIHETDLMQRDNDNDNGDDKDLVNRKKIFKASMLKGNTDARLVWLPMNRNSVRLCWEVVLMSRKRNEMFHILIDARTGRVLLRRNLTENLSNASYRIFNNYSPTPFISPSNSLPTAMGYSAPTTNQPAQVNRALIITNALDTNASPSGWINDGDNTTFGNNVDAYLDRNADDLPDLPLTTGSPFRAFDFPLDLTQDPITYSNTCVVNLFYWCNWMHDRLYEFGFTESAGNFQSNNFGRGGVGGDPVDAEAQDSSGINNANFSTPPDGSSGRMQMYLFTGPTPIRDGDFDNEIILHEYTHGLSNRRVGGGVGINQLQSRGLGEGWSDFYSLALSSQVTDNPNACYPEAPYASYQLNGGNQNYYFGLRRYPYSTSLTNCPGTFRDIDPGQASSHSGIPRNSAIGNSPTEIHNQGEIWCATLWDARANLIARHGFTNGNQLILQLVTDAMNLTPANPNFQEARDAILQADLIDTGSLNYQALWKAFAKRGLGMNASAPPSSTTSGLTESFVVPDTLFIQPPSDFNSAGPINGPFLPASQSYTLQNTDTNLLTWSVSASVNWVSISSSGGTLTNAGNMTNILVSINTNATSLAVGIYSGTLNFSNSSSGAVQTRNLTLNISSPNIYSFLLNTDPGWSRQGEWAFGQPTGHGGADHGFPDPSSGVTGSNVFGVNLNGDYSTANTGGPFYLTTGALNFTGVHGVSLQFSRWLNTDYPPYAYANVGVSTDGVNWNLIFQNKDSVEIADSSWQTFAYDISAYADNQPTVYVRWGYQIGSSAFDYSGWNIDDIVFMATPNLFVSLPASATEGDGTLGSQAHVSILHSAPTDITVNLSSSDTSSVTVPASVVIHAGQTNAAFSLTVLDDNLLNGTRTPFIFASTPGYSAGSNSIAIFDNESAALNITLPVQATEGDGTIQGQVSMSAIPDGDISVSLFSSDSNSLQVPLTMTILAGQTNGFFNAMVVDDSIINGDRTILVTAHVQNWTDASTNIVIHDNESTNLSLILPAQARENNGVLSNAGIVQIGGTLTTNLTVSLVSSNTAKLQVSPTCTILAGQTSGTFDLTTVSGNAPQFPITVAVGATAVGFGATSSTINIIDSQTPTAPFYPSPPDQSTMNPVNVTLTWCRGLGEGVEQIINGGFETADFTGWASSGFIINNGTRMPPSGDGATAPFDAYFSVLTGQFPPAISTLSQDLTLPTNINTITLSWADRIRNFHPDFGTNQQFRVEIRDTNNNTLSLIYCTGQHDSLLNDWVQRGFDISSFSGQTIRLTFIVCAEMDFLDVHLDDISVRCANLPPTTFSVYFSTNATPGFPDLQGTTTNTFWPLPKLNPFTNYYWQIVASRSNQTAGPVWQFSSLPTLYVNNLTLSAEDTNASNAMFSVSLSDVSSNTISVDFATMDGTAVSPGDYTATNGTLQFNPGETNHTIVVPIFFSTNLPNVKNFTLNLSNPTNAALGSNQGTGILKNAAASGPVIAFIPDRTNHAQTTIILTVTATNADNSSITYSLDPGAPTNAMINSTNGIFSWTPTDTNIGTNLIVVRATDDDPDHLFTTQSFTVIVVPRPTITSFQIFTNHVHLVWTAIAGDNYRLQSATNILGSWSAVPGDVTATNGSASKDDNSGQTTQRYYRVLVLP